MVKKCHNLLVFESKIERILCTHFGIWLNRPWGIVIENRYPESKVIFLKATGPKYPQKSQNLKIIILRFQ